MHFAGDASSRGIAPRQLFYAMPAGVIGQIHISSVRRYAYHHYLPFLAQSEIEMSYAEDIIFMAFSKANHS